MGGRADFRTGVDLGSGGGAAVGVGVFGMAGVCLGVLTVAGDMYGLLLEGAFAGDDGDGLSLMRARFCAGERSTSLGGLLDAMKVC